MSQKKTFHISLDLTHGELVELDRTLRLHVANYPATSTLKDVSAMIAKVKNQAGTNALAESASILAEAARSLDKAMAILSAGVDAPKAPESPYTEGGYKPLPTSSYPTVRQLLAELDFVFYGSNKFHKELIARLSKFPDIDHIGRVILRDLLDSSILAVPAKQSASARRDAIQTEAVWTRIYARNTTRDSHVPPAPKPEIDYAKRVPVFRLVNAFIRIDPRFSYKFRETTRARDCDSHSPLPYWIAQSIFDQAVHNYDRHSNLSTESHDRLSEALSDLYR